MSRNILIRFIRGLSANLPTLSEGEPAFTTDDNRFHVGRSDGIVHYYSKSEIDNLLNNKSDTGHTHDSRYYTESEVDNLLSGFNADQVDGYDIQKNGTDGSGIINFKT